MILFLKRIAKRLGIDEAISYVLLGRGLSFLSQPITLFLIARFFSPETQGFYYTFGSVLSASVFFELGLGYILTQFASHEFALLSWNMDGTLSGDRSSLSRLLSIIRKSLKWYGVLSVLFFAVLVPMGIMFFGSSPDASAVDYIPAWVLLVFFSSFGLFIYPVLAIVEGCGKVAALQKMKFYQLLSGVVSVWIIIFLHGGLLAASALAFSNFLVSAVWIAKDFRGLAEQLWRSSREAGGYEISWRGEVLPMQWRIAVSWVSGYLIYQLFNPLLFKYQSPAVAGQMGMSMSVANIVLSTSMAWISTKTPFYGALIKRKQYIQLDRLAFGSTIQAVALSLALSLAVVAFVYVLNVYFPHDAERILPVYAIAALLFSNVINVVITSMAGYLRAHKEEPFLINSVVGAILTAVVAWWCARYYNADVLCYSIAALNMTVGLPLAVYIFRRKRNEWGIDNLKAAEI